MSSTLPTKDCVVCGRTITWRKKWERSWDEVRYCSDGCRRRSSSRSARTVDEEIESRMRELLARTAAGKTICPSDVVRSLYEDWRPHMEPARAAARRLVARGEAEITQHGAVVDPSTAKGPIRIRPVR
jgi:hypothetical protein